MENQRRSSIVHFKKVELVITAPTDIKERFQNDIIISSVQQFLGNDIDGHKINVEIGWEKGGLLEVKVVDRDGSWYSCGDVKELGSIHQIRQDEEAKIKEIVLGLLSPKYASDKLDA